MGFKHRKLIVDGGGNVNQTQVLEQICQPFCNPNKIDGICPPGCDSLCSDICYPVSQITTAPPPPPPPPPRHQKLSNSVSITIAVLITVFSIFFCYTACKCYYARRNRARSRRQTGLRSLNQQREEEGTHDEFLDEDQGPVLDHPIWYIRTVGLQPSVISAITICKYKKGDGLVEGTECSVCLSEFQEDETLRLLPKCNHAFHIPCIDTWLGSHTNCPMCRAGIVRTTAGSPSPELVVENSGPVEDTQLGISENDGELRSDEEDLDSESRIGIEEQGEPQIVIKGDEICFEMGEVQPMRRSVSLDSVSASMISAAIAACGHPLKPDRNSDTNRAKVNESSVFIVPKGVGSDKSSLGSAGSSSIRGSIQKGPVGMKRSVSCSEKVLLSRHSRSRTSVLPL